jgi:hypothetical protein
MAYPQRFVIDPSIVGTADGEAAKAACKFGAVDLAMQEETVEFKVGSVVWATGWRPFDAAKIQPYGYDRFDNVITSLEFERLADPRGPTGGKIVRPGDGKEAKNIAFIQCAGSRDENYLRHCSRICCMATLKQTQYVREAWGEEAKSTVYYIDIRAIDRFEDFYANVWNDATVSFIKSKVARIALNEENGNPVLHGVNTEGSLDPLRAAELARAIARDGEGATTLITVDVRGGRDEADALDQQCAAAFAELQDGRVACLAVADPHLDLHQFVVGQRLFKLLQHRVGQAEAADADRGFAGMGHTAQQATLGFSQVHGMHTKGTRPQCSTRPLLRSALTRPDPGPV